MEKKKGKEQTTKRPASTSLKEENRQSFFKRYYLQGLCAILFLALLFVTALIMTNFNVYAKTTSEVQKPVGPISFTVFGGQTIKDIDKRLEQRNIIKAGDFIKEIEAYSQEMGLSFSEGWYQAGVYEINMTEPSLDLARDMLDATLKTLGEYASYLGDYKIEDIIKIASMIERETDDPEDLGLISSVIHNRLGLGMPLGIDATTRYELDDWQSPLGPRDFESSSSFNTRRNPGLPETGIGCPQEDAIIAAIMPRDTSYLYYHHDKDKQIHLSLTYEEHLRSIELNP